MIKKLILLLLVVCGGVVTANAVEYTVYFMPSANWSQANAKFALYMWNDNNSSGKTVDFRSSNGIYTATYDSDYSSGILILRIDPNTSSTAGEGYNDNSSYGWENGNKGWWAQTSNLTVPKHDIFFDMSKASGWDTTTKYYVVAGKSEIIDGEQWNENNVSNALIPASDYSTSNLLELTVTNKLLTANRTYEFKVVDGGQWYPSDNVQFTVPADGYYTIKYKYNTSDHTVSAPTTTLTQAVVFKYSVQQFINNNYTDLGEMSMTDGTASLTVSQSLTANTEILYKIKRAVYVNNVVDNDKETWTWYSNGTNGNYTYTPDFTKTYSLKFFYSPAYETSWVTGLAQADAYYYIGGSGNYWEVNQSNPLTSDGNGVYSITVNNKAGHTFAILPDYAFSTSTSISNENWKYAIHPVADDNVEIKFENNNGNLKVADSNANWEVESSYADYISFTLNTNDNTWSVEPYFTRTLPTAAEGYATFSSKYNVLVPEGLTAKYATAVNNGAITWETYASTGIKAGQGALLEGTAGDTYQFVPATNAVAPSTTNLMKAIDATTAASALGQSTEVGTTNYIFTKVNNKVGFFKVNSAGSYVNEGTAYLQVPNDQIPSQSPEFIALDGETTGIANVNAETSAKNQYYTLDGRHVAQPTKGLYIVNGKKVIIK